MKSLYITAILLTGLGISGAAMSQTCEGCWLNGVSPDGMKTTEPAKEAEAQITAPSEQQPEQRDESAKTTAVPTNSTKMKVVSTR